MNQITTRVYKLFNKRKQNQTNYHIQQTIVNSKFYVATPTVGSALGLIELELGSKLVRGPPAIGGLKSTG